MPGCERTTISQNRSEVQPKKIAAYGENATKVSSHSHRAIVSSAKPLATYKFHVGIITSIVAFYHRPKRLQDAIAARAQFHIPSFSPPSPASGEIPLFTTLYSLVKLSFARLSKRSARRGAQFEIIHIQRSNGSLDERRFLLLCKVALERAISGPPAAECKLLQRCIAVSTLT